MAEYIYKGTDGEEKEVNFEWILEHIKGNFYDIGLALDTLEADGKIPLTFGEVVKV